MSSHNLAFTQVDVKQTQFTWKIDHFKNLSRCISTGNRLESPTFIVKPDDDIKWQLYLWPNGCTASYTRFLSASLSYSTANKSKVHVNFSLGIVDNTGKKCYEQNKDHNENSFDGFDEFVPKKDFDSDASNILNNGILTIYCELTAVYKDSLNNIDSNIHQQPIYPIKQLLDAFEQQVEKQEFSDVKLFASCGKVLPAHKFVLAARSPVFSAMFTNDMIEKNDNSVTIKDLDYDSLKEMLRFMYAGKVENLDKLFDGILAAQEKYQINGLKELCEEYFFTNLNVENAVDILALSIRYNMDKIKLLAEKFIRCHAKDVCKSAAFKAIDEPNFLAEIVQILANI